MTLDDHYEILQSIPRAMVCGHCLYLPDGTIIWNGSTDGIVFLSSDGHIPDCTNDPEIYSAIKEAISRLDPPKDWREKIIQLIKTATMDELTENALTNGDIRFGLFAECVYVNKPDTQTTILWSPEIVGAAHVRRDEILRAKRRAQDDDQLEAIERILS